MTDVCRKNRKRQHKDTSGSLPGNYLVSIIVLPETMGENKRIFENMLSVYNFWNPSNILISFSHGALLRGPWSTDGF